MPPLIIIVSYIQYSVLSVSPQSRPYLRLPMKGSVRYDEGCLLMFYELEIFLYRRYCFRAPYWLYAFQAPNGWAYDYHRLTCTS